MNKLILASNSKGRKELLESVKANFVVEPSDYEEDMTLKMKPVELAKFLSRGKAEDVAKRHKDGIIIGADSFAVFGDQLLGKPHTLARAREMLTMLSGQRHTFVTGFTIIDAATGKSHTQAVETVIYMRELSASEIEAYLAKEDVLNNAGAYIIQKTGAILIERVEGSFTNVTGLPLAEVAEALKDFGVELV